MTTDFIVKLSDMTYLILVAITLSLAVLSTLFYRCVNKGLSSSSRHQQLTRLSVASVIAMAPWFVAGQLPCGAGAVVAAAVSVLWGITYPLLYHLSNRKDKSEYDNQMDIALGLYAFGALSALQIALSQWPVAAALVTGLPEGAMLALVLAQWVYYALYHEAIDFKGMTIVQSTNVNEVLEFARSYPALGCVVVIVLLLALTAGPMIANLQTNTAAALPVWLQVAEFAAATGILCLIFAGRRSPARRCGLVALYLVIRDYRKENSQYAEKVSRRTEQLTVTPLQKCTPTPHTVVMVIGESANRDFMSAFKALDRETTPWLTDMARHEGTILFPKAYSCAMVTVNSLQRALTEANQYNDKEFADSVSIIDVARKLGYKVYWFSNQGHLGAFDTPVTLVANTADEARWTDQQLNRVPYDERLVDYLDMVDRQPCNKLVVIHLKGSHFNFSNRYPAGSRQWTPRKGDDANVVNYLNSIHYTDSILQRIYDYGVTHLNMDAMVYFSDHATIPDRTRTPGFLGFGMTRIPLFVWLSDRYSACHPLRYEALKANSGKYFTNDLVYELMCGIFDIKSDNYDESNSLASDKYKYTRDMLLTYDGKVRIADDTTDDQA